MSTWRAHHRAPSTWAASCATLVFPICGINHIAYVSNAICTNDSRTRARCPVRVMPEVPSQDCVADIAHSCTAC